MATQSTNINAQTSGMSGNVPVGKTQMGTTSGVGQPGQMGTSMGGTQMPGQMTGATNTQGQGQGQNFGQQGYSQQQGYGQDSTGRGGFFDDIADWFRDPFNLGMSGRRRSGGEGGGRLEDRQGQGTGRHRAGYGNELQPYYYGGGGSMAGSIMPFSSPFFGGEMDVFRDMDQALSRLGSFTPSMRLDIKENDANYTATIDMPGVDKNNVNVEVDDKNRSIIVSANVKKDEVRDEEFGGTRVHRIERASGSGQRILRFPPNCDLNAVKADLSNGVLYVNVPKIPGQSTTGYRKLTIGEGAGGMGTGAGRMTSSIGTGTTGSTSMGMGGSTGTSYTQAGTGGMTGTTSSSSTTGTRTNL